jgi:hypothetical protein
MVVLFLAGMSFIENSFAVIFYFFLSGRFFFVKTTIIRISVWHNEIMDDGARGKAIIINSSIGDNKFGRGLGGSWGVM